MEVQEAKEQLETAEPETVEKSQATKSEINPVGSLPSDLGELIMLRFKPTPLEAKDKLYQFFHKYHSNTPEIKYLLGSGTGAAGFTEDLERLANAVKEQNSDRDAQAMALYTLATGYQSSADLVATLGVNNLSLDDYIKNMYPGLQKEGKYFFDNLKRWEGQSWESLREIAKDYAQDIIKNYSKIKLKIPNVNNKGEFDPIEAERLGKRVRSMLLAMEKASVGLPIEDISLQDVEGESITLSDFKGVPLIIYIWSSKCKPCTSSMSKYQGLLQNSKSRVNPIKMLTLSVDESRHDLDEFMKNNSMPFANSWIGKNNKLLFEWGVSGYPTLLFLSSDSVVSFKGVGPSSILMVNKIIQKGR